MSILITCGRCALKTPDGKTCRLLNVPIEDPKDGCPAGVSHLEKCEICHQELMPNAGFLEITNGKVHILCEMCNSRMNTCSACGHGTECLFESSSSDLPKQVQQQFKTPQGYVVTTIRNPERIRETCEKGCHCYSPENECLRQNNYCEHYKAPW